MSDNQYVGENNATIIQIDFSDTDTEGFSKSLDIRLPDKTGASIPLGDTDVVEYPLPASMTQKVGRIEVQPYAIDMSGDKIMWGVF